MQNQGLVSVPPAPFDNCWDFVTRAVWTRDEASGTIRQFPSWEYLQRLTEIRTKHKIFAVEKSRRMMISWWMIAVYLYDVLTESNHSNFVGSKKLGDAAYLLGDERMLGVYKRIPAEVWPGKPDLIATGKEGKGYTLLTCPQTGSSITAIASGADQLRSFTATNVFCDEFAFWERAEESWASMLPTIQGGGHIDIVSTPELGAYMYDLLYGEQ